MGAHAGSVMDERVKTALELMTANLKEPLPLSRIARRVGLSVAHLSHLFKMEIGQPPGSHHMKLRMEKAAELLADPTLSVKEIMDAVGFRDKSDFVRSFKKAYGVAPSAYQKKKAKPSVGKNHKID